jgi:hypothetical protein
MVFKKLKLLVVGYRRQVWSEGEQEPGDDDEEKKEQ